MGRSEFIIVGAGKSLRRVAFHGATIACNRAIEAVAADYWVWVDQMHYERSKWHPHARRAVQVHPEKVARELPCDEEALLLHGGTLTVAAHFALKQGATRIVFAGCDAWTPGRDRYHAWDGAPLDETGRRLHERHLETTAEGIRMLARAYPDVELLDATTGPRHLGLPFVELEKIAMTETKALPIRPDPSVAAGYGRLVGVTPLGTNDVAMWFEDASGTIRGVRMGCDLKDGFALEMKGQAWVSRT